MQILECRRFISIILLIIFVVVDHMQRHVCIFRSEYLVIIITMLYVLYIVDLDNCIAGTKTACG